MTTLRDGARRVARRLCAPIDIAGIVYYRIAFGAIALWEVYRYAIHGWIERYYIDPTFHFTYYGFDWVSPWPGDGMYWHFAALGLLAFGILVGFCYRASAALFCVGFTYVFLLEKSNYLNHLYLFCLLSFLLIFLPAHRAFSVDAWLRPKIRSENAPTWSLWLIRFQMGVVYFYAGVAKINPDWLAGWPLRIWLPQEQSFPLIGRFFVEPWLQLAFSYGGLLLDLLGPFLLLWPRTRLLTFAVFVLFHLTNARLFGIGIFPWLSIASTLPFFPADWPRRVFRWPRRTPVPAAPSSDDPLRLSQRLLLGAVALWVAIQLLVPLRHWLYPGNVSWTEQGHNFAWHQKLRNKACVVDFTVTDKSSGQSWAVRESRLLSRRQKSKMSSRPHMVLEFAHFLKRYYREAEGLDLEVRALVTCSLNGRPPQLLVDPEVDLAAQPRNLRHKRWIVPLREERRDER